MSSDRPAEPPADQLVIGGPDAPRTRGGGRGWWIGAGAAVLAIGGGAAAWAAASFFGTGAQPAEALPATTLGYVSVDLDPNGAQKIEALKLARKFPAFKEQVGLDSDDDLRQWIFEKLADEAGCTMDFRKDVEPWLGSRAAVAAVPLGGADKPVPVFVLQTTDAEKAKDGVAALAGCGADGDVAREDSWAFDGDWVVMADSQGQAEQVVEATAKGALADDEDFRAWMGRVGDSGLMTAYAAPAVGDLIGDEIAKSMTSDAPAAGPMLEGCSQTAQEYADNLRTSMASFTGAAATLKLNDGGLELSAVADSGIQDLGGAAFVVPGATGSSAVTTLPADTAAAYGVAMPKDWGAMMDKQFQAMCGDDFDAGALFGELSKTMGFDLLEDGPKLFGTSAALALGPGLDVEALVNAGDPGRLPLALKTTGDKATVDRVLAQLVSALGMPRDLLVSSEGDSGVAVGFDRAYADKVVADGDLGGDATFRDVVPHAAKASLVLYVNVDRLQGAIGQMAAGQRQVSDNVEPLRAVGLSAWNEGDEMHALLRVSVD